MTIPHADRICVRHDVTHDSRLITRSNTGVWWILHEDHGAFAARGVHGPLQGTNDQLGDALAQSLALGQERSPTDFDKQDHSGAPSFLPPFQFESGPQSFLPDDLPFEP